MTNTEKYLDIFTSTLEIEKEQTKNLCYQAIPSWD